MASALAPAKKRRKTGITTALTPRRLAQLYTVTRPLFQEGGLSEAYDTPRFMELFHLGWTPLRCVYGPKGPVLVGAWMSMEYFHVEMWEWWRDLHPKSRRWVITDRQRNTEAAELQCGTITNPYLYYDWEKPDDA